jgi:hypothetical protein
MGRLCLIAIEQVSNYILLGHPAEARDHDTWRDVRGKRPWHLSSARSSNQRETEPRGSWRMWNIILGHTTRRTSSMCSMKRARPPPLRCLLNSGAAPKATPKAEEMRTRMQEQLHNTNNEPGKRIPGRPPKVGDAMIEAHL